MLASVPTASLGVSGGNLWLKMIKTGQRYKTYYSVDGTNWVFVYDEGDSLSNVKVGVFSYNRTGTSSDLKVGFDYFRIATSATATGSAGGTVPATLALTLGAPASFGVFTPGVAKDYTASTTADVVSTAGDAALTVSGPEPPQQRRVLAAVTAGGDDHAVDVVRAGLPRELDDRVQPAHRSQRRAPDRQLQHHADLHAVDDDPLGGVRVEPRRGQPRLHEPVRRTGV